MFRFCKCASSCCPFRTCSDPPLHQKLDFQREIRRRGSLILPLLPFCLQIGFSDETLSFFFSLQCTNLIFEPSVFSMKRRQKRRLIWPESSRTSHRYYLSFRSVELSVRLDWWNHCACNCDKWGTRRGDIWTHTEYSHYPHFTGRIHFQESCGRISIPTTACV